jgi:hypothetical protein
MSAIVLYGAASDVDFVACADGLLDASLAAP